MLCEMHHQKSLVEDFLRQISHQENLAFTEWCGFNLVFKPKQYEP